MKNQTKKLRTNTEIAESILGDVYSCLKIVFRMNIDKLDYQILLKVLDKHFDLSEFNKESINFMCLIHYSICEPIHRNPLKYFNFSYKKPNKNQIKINNN